MAFGRYLGHVKRKLRVVLIFVVAITFTASLAFYNSQQVSGGPLALQPDERVERLEPPVENPEATEKYVPKKEEDGGQAIKDEQKEETTAEEPPKKTTTLFNDAPSQAAQQQQAPSGGYPPLKEFVGEFDTADIYKQVIANQGGRPTGSSPRKASTEKLKVFILPFTHVDPGWLKTFDAYSSDTDKILDNMHKFMKENPAMRFMWAEFVFFERWWKQKNETVKADVKKMVTEGQFELASGSWVMTDEANAYFPVSVDNIVEGHQFLLKEFGIRASTIWTNDPFGYSNSVPYLFRQTGMKRNVINRIHHGIKGYLQANKAIPFQWRQYFDDKGDDDVLTHVLPYTHYDILNSCGPNPGACCEFDFKRMTHWACPGPKPEPITSSNVKKKAATLVGQLKTMASMYEAPVLLQMHGDDFRFEMIEEWHQHHDNFLPLFEEINKGSEVEIRFGTFNDYFTEMEKWYAKNTTQPAVLTGDFFPYKCALGDLWTGYYTTRPFYKRQGRLLHSLIRSADIASAMNPTNAESVKELESARRTLSLFQHHDAITGTSKIHVMKDYSKLLYEAQTKANKVLQVALTSSLKAETAVTHSAALFNETQTKHQLIIDGQAVYISVYNPLPYSLSDTISVRVNSSRLQVSSNGNAVPAQIEPFIYKGDVAQDNYLLTFPVKLRPLGVTSFELKEGDGPTKLAEIHVLEQDLEKMKSTLPSIFKLSVVGPESFQLATSRLVTTHNPSTGLLTSIKTGSVGSHQASMAIVAYKNSAGGAYLMRARGDPQSYAPAWVPKMLVKGSVQQSAHLFLGNIYQRITAKELDGPLGEQLEVHFRINIQGERNTEVAMRIETDMEGQKLFGDSVGMQLLRRESYRNLDVSANYYPMPSAAVVQSEKARLTISSNVEHGMKQIDKGVEIMLDRILNQDDGKGLGSSADAIPTDMLPVDMQFSLLFEKSTQKDDTEHYSAHTPAGHLSVQNVLYPPVVAVSSKQPVPSGESLPALPCDYQLLTVRHVENNKKMLILFRHGISRGGEAVPGCGSDITAVVRSLLKAMKISSVQETNLSGTEKIGALKTVDQVEVHVEPFKFITLIAS